MTRTKRIINSRLREGRAKTRSVAKTVTSRLLETDKVTALARHARENRVIYRSLLASALIVFCLSLVAPLGIPGVASAFSTRSQNDWSGGVGTGPNQYASAGNVNTGNTLTLGSTVNSWCNTAHCNTSWTKRQVLRYDYSDAGGQDLNVVSVKVDYKPSMQADFDDLRFTAANNTSEIPYYLGSKVDGSSALVYIAPGSINHQVLEINMYYGNPAASSQSDSSIMLLTDNFRQNSTTSSLITEWGTQGGGNGQFNYPTGVAQDSSGNIYVADSQNLRVQKFSNTGTHLMNIGTGGSGTGQFNTPSRIAINPANGDIYVTDSSRNKVLVFNSSGVFQFEFGGTGSGNGQLSGPTGIVIANGGVFVVDTGNNRFTAWQLNGTWFTSSGSFGSAFGQLNGPSGVTTIPDGLGNSWFAIADSGNHRIVLAGADTGMVPNNLPIDSFGSYGTGNNNLISPSGISRDSSGNFYVADNSLQQIKKFNSEGKYVGHWDTQTIDVLVGSEGKVYSSNYPNHKIQKYEPQNLTAGLTVSSAYTMNGDELSFPQGSFSSTTYDRSQTRVYEYDFKVDLSDAPVCGEYMRPSRFINHADADTVGLVFQGVNCDDDGQYYYLGPDFVIGGVSYPVQSELSAIKIRPNQYIRVRVAALAGQGYRFGVSFDASGDFKDVTLSQVGTSNLDSYLMVQGQNTNTTVRNLVIYNSTLGGMNTVPSVGIEESVGGKTGTLESAVIDWTADPAVFGAITVDASGDGSTLLYVRTSDDDPVNFNGDKYYFCGGLESGAAIYDSACVASAERYMQYLLVMTEPAGGNFTVNSVDIQYVNDSGPPPTNASNIVIKTDSSGSVINGGAWSRELNPYFSWTPGQDEPAGSGIKGYCIYFGQSANGDPATNKGDITDGSAIGVDDVCPYAVADPYMDLSTNGGIGGLQSGATYYFAVKAIDNLNQIYQGDAARTSYRVDTQAPSAQTLFSLPSGYINTKQFTVNWPSVPGVSFTDAESGIAGLKYCVTNILLGSSGCGSDDTNWYGASGTGGSMYDASDVLPAGAGAFQVSAEAATRLDDEIYGVNFMSIVLLDNAGNVTSMPLPSAGVVLITQLAPTAPQNLTVTPSSNTSNAFSFTWDVPSQFVGGAGDIDYCWTVNEPIAEDGGNCTWTGKGITQLASGPFATIQGTNTLYLMARDQSSNFDNANVASTTFTATTVAPGPPQNTEISDVSTRATSTWKLALSWSAPAQVGAGISSYKIFRSTDNVSFTQVGSTSSSNLSFIDSGLSQQTYYYHVKACDSANACSVAGNVVSKLPTGRYTTPPVLTSDTNQPRVEGIGTKKATVLWYTDRGGDSKVAFGTKPGQYGPAEIGSSTQTTNHSVTLTNLQPGITYYYVAKWTDEDGNTGVSQERSFRTSEAPEVKNAEAKNIKVTSADIIVTVKSASSLNLLYGVNEGFGGVKPIQTSATESEYILPITGLQDGQKYVYRFVLTDSDNNEYPSDVYTFDTPLRPRILNLRFQPVEGSASSSQKITWDTNVPANSILQYGPRGGKQLEELRPDLTTSHEVVINGLEDDSDYTLIARSTDAAGNTATSDLQFFRTALDTRPPKISDITVETTIRGNGSEARGQIIVSWKTDEKATSQVAFAQGQSGSFTNLTPEDNRLTTDHTVVISNLDTASIY